MLAFLSFESKMLLPLIRTTRLCVLLMLLIAPANSFAVESAHPFIVAVVPQFSSLQIHKDWTPFLARVAHDSGIPLTLKTYQSIPKFEEEVLKSVPDFAFMNPYHAVMAKRAAGYVPLVRDSTPLTGILLVRRNGPIRTIKDLAGEKVAFPAPNAFGASLYMRALLAEQEKIHVEPLYVDTHSNVFRYVILDQAAAGGSVNAAFQREPAALVEQLRVIFETPPAAPHPFSIHPRISSKTREAVMAAILRLNKSTDALPLLNAVQMPNPVAADYVRDYQPLERLKLDKYLIIEKE